ncbi:hypothetical protein TNCV_4665851 [Trichonephila clavipes]|nr:hypothetical protein TNCV_4665851 [Trichonephila clavipes]
MNRVPIRKLLKKAKNTPACVLSPIDVQFDKCWMDDWLSVSIQISEKARSLMLLINERLHMIAISSVVKTEARSAFLL